MLKIGEFSRLSQVTVKTLHHYDEMGLLKPSLTDPFTSYRYYTLDQLPRLHTIMALKELGLSLEEIARLLSENLSTEQIRGMYRLKQSELQQRVREEQARLAQIEFRLRQIEQEGIISTLDIVIKRIEPFSALTMRRIFHSRQEREVVARGIEEAIKRGDIAWTGGVPTAIFYEDEFRGDYLDTEMVVPVNPTHAPVVSLGDAGTFTLRELPAIEAAGGLHAPGRLRHAQREISAASAVGGRKRLSPERHMAISLSSRADASGRAFRLPHRDSASARPRIIPACKRTHS